MPEFTRPGAAVLRRALILLVFGMSAQAFAAPRLAPAPDWVKPLSVDTAAPGQLTGETEGQSMQYLLSDTQIRVEGNTLQRYHHGATRALNEHGVEEAAHIEIAFDPSYQDLTLHAIAIWRNGRRIEKLAGAKIRMLQRETELDAQMIDGSLSADIFLDDVRVGDVVEYSDTIRGANPALAAHFGGQVDLQWSVPVRQTAYRLLWPNGRKIQIWAHNHAENPKHQTRGSFDELSWERHNTPALNVDPGAPAWWDPYPWAQWSEYADWAGVVAWALPLYATPARPGDALQAEVARINSASSDPAVRAAAALNFVQREVRYLGDEVGAGSYAPRPPALVLSRRFGDCKDKALLLLTLLRALGISADAALVNTRVGRGIASWQPGPDAFDHVIVRAQVDGRDYWLDPTRYPQPGGLDRIDVPDYGRALVIAAGTRELSTMPRALPLQRAVKTLYNARAGFDKPVLLTVTTTLTGASAEEARTRLANTPHEELQRRYLNFYAASYPGATLAAPMDVSDEPDANRLTVTEHYALSDFWKPGRPQHVRVSLEVPEVMELLRAPTDRKRSAPLALARPQTLAHEAELLLPTGWSIQPEHSAIDDPAFHLDRNVRLQNGQLHISDHLELRGDEVSPERMPEYLAHLSQARDALDYNVERSSDQASPSSVAASANTASFWRDFNWPVALAAALLLAGLLRAARWVYRYNPPGEAAPENAEPGPLSGWLVVFMLTQILAPLVSLSALFKTLPTYGLTQWNVLTAPGHDSFKPLWAPMLLQGLAAQIALTVSTGLLLLLLFKKRSSLTRVFIAFNLAALGYRVLDLALFAWLLDLQATTSDIGGLIGRLLGTLLWSSYLLKSSAVKQRMVRDYRSE